MNAKITLDQPGTYRIRVQGKLSENWAAFFEGMAITITVDGDGHYITELTGELLDQGAVQGVLQNLYNLGFPLISVETIVSGSKE